MLKSCRSVAEPKGHYVELKQAVGVDSVPIKVQGSSDDCRSRV